MKISPSVRFACITCGDDLGQTGSQLVCASCGSQLTLYNGVLRVQNSTEAAGPEPFKAADAGTSDAQTGEEDERLADLRFLAPFGGVVLVQGAGSGTLSLRLAASARAVIITDSCLSRLQSLAARAERIGADNIVFIQSGNAGTLPVLLSGVDTLVVLGGTGPLESLESLIRRYSEVLKATGTLILASPNRMIPGFIRSKVAATAALPLSLPGARREFKAGGFERVEAYAVLPHPRRPPLFLASVDSPGPFAHLMRDLFPLFETVSPELRASYRYQLALAKAARTMAIATGTAALARFASFGYLFIATGKGAERSFAAKLSLQLGKDLCWTVATGSPEGGTTTLLGFHRNRPSSIAVVAKVQRDHGGAPDSRATQEAALLRTLASKSLPGPVPEPIWCGQIDGHSVLAQTPVRGRPVSVALDASGAPKIRETAVAFATAASWCRALGDASHETQDTGFDLCDDILAPFAKMFPHSAARHAVLLESSVNACAQTRPVIQHGDFTRHNVLTDDQGRAAVIDWTDARLRGALLHDLFFFIATYNLQSRRTLGIQGFLEAFRSTFFTSGPYRTLVRLLLQSEARHAGLSDVQAESSFVLFLAERAVFEAKKNHRALRRGQLPRFAVSLAAEVGMTGVDAQNAQIWTMFLDEYVHRGAGIVSG